MSSFGTASVDRSLSRLISIGLLSLNHTRHTAGGFVCAEGSVCWGRYPVVSLADPSLVQRLTRAIREKDKRHLLTVGLVDWSLDRPGLTSGFVPSKIAEWARRIESQPYFDKTYPPHWR